MLMIEAVVMCGGVGTKLWPASRQGEPKQFLPFLPGGRSLIEDNLDFLRKTLGDGLVVIQTNVSQLALIQSRFGGFPEGKIFIESALRNTGPALALLSYNLIEQGKGEEPFMLMQSDVLREPKEKVVEFMAQVEHLVRTTGKLITGGLRPQNLVFGVDYLIAEPMQGEPGSYQMTKWLGRENSREIFDYQKQGKDLFLHACHYAWTPNKVIEAYAKYKPEWANKDMVLNRYDQLPAGAAEEVFFKVLEGGIVVELPFTWRDFGTWSSVAEYAKEHPEMGLMDDAGNLVWSRSGRMVVLPGIKDCAVVDYPDALLVVPLSEADGVGDVVKELKDKGKSNLL